MKRLIVRCGLDVASRNICDAILAAGDWSDLEDAGGMHARRRGDDLMVDISVLHIRYDGIDEAVKKLFGFEPDLVIFPSEHTSSSGMPALTVHTLGNFHEADIGGRPGTLVPAPAAEVSDALRDINHINTLDDFKVCFEATHHGPYLRTPAFFIEIGSDDRHWGDHRAGETLAQVICKGSRGNGFPTMIGIGGGHYCPRFTELALTADVNFGSILPNYQLEGRSDEDVARMIGAAMDASSSSVGFIHRKSMSGAEAARLRRIAESLGYGILAKDSELAGL